MLEKSKATTIYNAAYGSSIVQYLYNYYCYYVLHLFYIVICYRYIQFVISLSTIFNYCKIFYVLFISSYPHMK